MRIEATPERVLIGNSAVELCADVSDGLRLALRAGGVDVLVRGGAVASGEPLEVELPDRPTLQVQELSDSAILVMRGSVGRGELSIALRVYEDSPWVSVAEVYECDKEPADVSWFEAVWRFVDWEEPGEVFSPLLVPEENDVIGRHVMRSPVLTAQCAGRAAALVGDVDAIRRQQAMPPCMNLLRENGAPVFRFGLRPHRVRGHVYFQHVAEPQRAERLHHSYQLWVSAGAGSGGWGHPRSREGAAIEAASARVWQQWGGRNLRGAIPQPMGYEDFARQIYPRAIEQRWREMELGGKRVGAIASNRSYTGDVWMCPWFSQARSAYGMYLWGKWLGNDDWMQRAVATRDLHLCAPQRDGLFPTVFVFGADGRSCRWVESHHQGGGPGIYHLFDMSWTVYQLLRWHRDALADAATIEFARRYCAGVLALQSKDGSWPAYVDAKTRRAISKVDRQALLADLNADPRDNGYVRWGVEKGWPAERFVNSAEDSATLLCLAELARLLPESDPDRARFLAAARANAAWLEREVFPEAKWIDFEVYFSCSTKPWNMFDARSGQGPQNTLCMHMAAAGLLVLYELTREVRWLDLARRALSRMSLYQQVWDPPFLNFYGYGGYGVMNTDGEWSDARQGQFADTHLDFHRVLGEEEQRGMVGEYTHPTRPAETEQLERAVAACRASFSAVFLPGAAAWYPTGWNRRPEGMAAENHAHSGVDDVCGVSSFDWGAGSALATAAYMRVRKVWE